MHHAYHGFFPQFCEVGGLDKFHLYKKNVYIHKERTLPNYSLKVEGILCLLTCSKSFLVARNTHKDPPPPRPHDLCFLRFNKVHLL